MKKLFIATLFAAAAFAQSNPVLSFSNTPSTAVYPGSSAKISIALALPTGAVAPAGVQWSVSYPVDLISDISWAAGAASTAAQKNVTCNTAAGQTTCVAVGLNAIPFAAGEVAQMTVTIAPSAIGQSIPLTLTKTYAAGPDGAALTLVASGASISLKLANFDIDGNGVVNADDFLETIQQAIGAHACAAGDLDKNGKCDIVDVMRVFLQINYLNSHALMIQPGGQVAWLDRVQRTK